MENNSHKKPFDLLLAQQNHPLITRGGLAAKFIAYIPDVEESEQIVFVANNKLRVASKEGQCYAHTAFDLFLAPLGYCEGKPVFAGDVLTGDDHNPVYKGKEFVVELCHNEFIRFKWPSKAPVVETKLSDAELMQAYFPYGKLVCAVSDLQDYRRIANKAIERAIADGDVTPTSVVYKLLDEVKYKYDCGAGHNMSYSCTVESVMDEYLEGLK